MILQHKFDFVVYNIESNFYQFSCLILEYEDSTHLGWIYWTTYQLCSVFHVYIWTIWTMWYEAIPQNLFITPWVPLRLSLYILSTFKRMFDLMLQSLKADQCLFQCLSLENMFRLLWIFVWSRTVSTGIHKASLWWRGVVSDLVLHPILNNWSYLTLATSTFVHHLGCKLQSDGQNFF